MQKVCQNDIYQNLSRQIIPKHYDLFFNIDYNDYTYEAKNSILLEIKDRTNEISFNCKNLDITNITVQNQRNIIFEPDTVVLNNKEEKCKLIFNKVLTPGFYTLEIDFEGKVLGNGTNGLYKFTYSDKDKNINSVILTSFEPCYARQCFPCWDELVFKASFSLTLIIPKNKTAISNMPIIETKKLKRNTSCKFDKTPPIPPYLFGFIVGDFDFIEAKSSDGVIIRAYTIKDKTQFANYGLDVANRALSFYNKFLGVRYPLSKLDIIAVSEFSLNGMENWGLIFIREINFLVNPASCTNHTKQWVTLQICHLIAHQWMNNLVTIEWWTHQWFAESLTRFLETLSVDYIFPSLNIWRNFAIEPYATSLELDSLKAIEPIEIVYKDPKEIDEQAFGYLAYNKGPAIIRMMYHFVGEENFKLGIQDFFATYQYKTVKPDNFYKCLEKYCNKPITSIINTWIQQPGVPVVSVYIEEYGCDCKGVLGTTFRLSQSRFAYTINSNSNKEPIWKIPISIITSKNPDENYDLLLETKEARVFIPGLTRNDWIKLNPNVLSYYRVQYTSDLLQRFLPSLRKNILSVADKMGLLNDLFAMVKFGYSDISDMLNLLDAFDEEKEFVVWSIIGRILSKLSTIVINTSSECDFLRFQENIREKLSIALGFKLKYCEDKLKTFTFGETTWLDDKSIINEIIKYDENLEKQKILPNIIRLCCYQTTILNDNKLAMKQLLRLYHQIDLHEQKILICETSSFCQDENQRKVFTFGFPDENNKNQTKIVVVSLIKNESWSDELWKNYRQINENFKSTDQNFELHAFKNTYDNCALEPLEIEMEDFFINGFHASPSEYQLKLLLKELESKIRWPIKDQNSLKEHLLKH